MAKLKRNIKREAVKQRWQKQEERKAQTERARQGRWAKKTAPQPNLNAEMPQQDEAEPSTSAAPTEEAMEPPPPTPGPVPTPDMDEEILEFDDLPQSTSATPIGDLLPFPTTPTAPMDTGETTPPPLVIDDRSERIEQLEKELKDRDDTITFLREQAQPLSPGDLDGLETAVYQFKAFLDEQPMVRTLLSKKTKAHLLLHHFVPFARQHGFLGLLDEQGDEALHSVWRRLEQLWKTMPDSEQMRQQLEHHFVSNWLLDTGRLDELKLREEEQREQAEEDKTNEESDQDADIDIVD